MPAVLNLLRKSFVPDGMRCLLSGYGDALFLPHTPDSGEETLLLSGGPQQEFSEIQVPRRSWDG
jgi:hypothetical protein